MVGGLRQLEKQLAATQQLTHIGSWAWDLETNVVTWSDELYRIYGLSPGSVGITVESFLARVHPDDRARVRGSVEEAIARGGVFSYTERILRPDGTLRHLSTNGEVECDASGRAVAVVGTCRDVTDERQREETIQRFADIVNNVQIGLSVWKVEQPADEARIRLVAFNPASEGIVRLSLADQIGKPLREIVPYAAGGELERLLVHVARTAEVAEASVSRSRDPRNPTRALAMKAFPLPGDHVGLAVEDVTAAANAHKLQEGEHRVLEMIATGAPLGDILTRLVLFIEDLAPPTIASVLLLDIDGVHVRHGAAPSLPAAYNTAIDGAPIGPARGSCGTAAFERRPVIVDDIDSDPLWVDYRDLAREHGLRACWSTPIFAPDTRVLGTFALYFREPRRPTPEERELVARATYIAGIAIHRRQLEDQMRDLSEHVESIREEERTGIAREIHDELGQALTGLKMDLAYLTRHDLRREELLERVRAMASATDGIIEEVRRISAELRPGVLDQLGLLAALEWQAQEFEKRTGTRCIVRSNVGDRLFARDVSTAIFRIFQEALTNVVRHANAHRVDARLERAHGSLVLEVRDDGAGISSEAARSPRSLGLLGMRERARRLGGAASIAGGDDGGTVVSVRIPLSAEQRS